jgi:hypothetical protein
MNKVNENRFSMFHAVLAVCTKYAATWTGVVGYKKAHDELEVNVASIKEASTVQETNMKGAALDKRFKRDAMSAKTLEVARAVYAYAEDEGDLVLREKMDLSESDLNRKRDAVVSALCQGVKDVAGVLIASLGDYGLVAADVTALQTAIDNYTAVVSAPRNATGVRKGATAEINALVKDSMKVLNNRMDKLMHEFEVSAPEFFQEYFDARIIVDSGGKSEPLAEAA